MGIASIFELVDEVIVHRQTCLFICRLYFPLHRQLMQCRSLFNRKTVGRDVLHIQLQNLSDVLIPFLERLLWKTVNQIDADVADTGVAKSCNGRLYLFGRMSSA